MEYYKYAMTNANMKYSLVVKYSNFDPFNVV